MNLVANGTYKENCKTNTKDLKFVINTLDDNYIITDFFLLLSSRTVERGIEMLKKLQRL